MDKIIAVSRHLDNRTRVRSLPSVASPVGGPSGSVAFFSKPKPLKTCGARPDVFVRHLLAWRAHACAGSRSSSAFAMCLPTLEPPLRKLDSDPLIPTTTVTWPGLWTPCLYVFWSYMCFMRPHLVSRLPAVPTSAADVANGVSRALNANSSCGAGIPRYALFRTRPTAPRFRAALLLLCVSGSVSRCGVAPTCISSPSGILLSPRRRRAPLAGPLLGAAPPPCPPPHPPGPTSAAGHFAYDRSVHVSSFLRVSM